MSDSASSDTPTAAAPRSVPAAALALLRPLNLAIAAAAALVGAWLQAVAMIEFVPALWSAAAVVSAVAGANAFNDWTDLRADTVNRPDRPVPSGALSPRAALATALVAYAAALVLAARVSLAAVDVVVLWVLLTMAYSLALKGVPGLGNAVAAAVTASVVYFGALSQSRQIGRPVFAALVLAFLFNLAREFAKDAQDVDGDRVQGVRTLATVRGREAALLASRVTIVVGMLATAVPFPMGVFGVWYGVVAIAVEALLVAALAASAPTGDRASPGRASACLKAAMVAGLIAVSAGLT